MKNGLRQCMAWLHTWTGLLPGWVLYFMFLTGTTGYFYHEIDRWMQPELPLWHTVDPREAVAAGLRQLQRAAPDASLWSFELPDRNTRPTMQLAWAMLSDRSAAKPTRYVRVIDDERHGAHPRETGGGYSLYRMHWGLRYLPVATAYWAVGVCAMCLLLALLSGVIIHRRVFKDFFTLRRGKGLRSWLDAHALFGVMALPFHLMIAYSGLVLLMSVYLPILMQETARLRPHDARLFDRAYNQLDAQDPEKFYVPRSGIAAPLVDVAGLLARTQADGKLLFLTILNPNDRNARIIATRIPYQPMSRLHRAVYNGVTGELITQSAAPFRAAQINHVLTGLHEAKYAGPWLRWLYFLSGLMSAGMIATGLILWTAKRRQKHYENQTVQINVRLVERLNVGVIIGLPVAIAAYFWANRLIPTTLEYRAEWELNTLFAVWAVLVLYAATRPLMRAWFELLSLAVAAYGLLPLLDMLTTQRHVWFELIADEGRGDWPLAAFDLTVLGMAAMFATIAWRVRTKVELLDVPQAQIEHTVGMRLNAVK